MNNEEILAEVINGTNNTQKVEFEGLKAPLTLRPLNYKELKQLKKLEKGSQKAKVKIKQGMSRNEIKDQVQDLEQELDYAQVQENIAKTKAYAISLSANIPEKLIDSLPPGLPDDIFEKVMEISGITEKDLDLLKNFRKDE